MKKELTYEKKFIDNFGILGKGSSLVFLKKYYLNFQSCYVLSDFDDEFKIYKEYLQNKKIIHFANREPLSRLKKRTYEEYNIKDVQLSTRFSFDTFKTLTTYLKYKIRNPSLKVNLLDTKALKYNQGLPKEYKNKFPNTGILSILYAIDYISPKNLWIFGIDFYSTPYSTLQTTNSHLDLVEQKNKVKRLDLVKILNKKISESTHINFHVLSYSPEWIDVPNLKKYNLE